MTLMGNNVITLRKLTSKVTAEKGIPTLMRESLLYKSESHFFQVEFHSSESLYARLALERVGLEKSKNCQKGWVQRIFNKKVSSSKGCGKNKKAVNYTMCNYMSPPNLTTIK